MTERSGTSGALTKEERDAVRQRAKELRAQEKAGKNRAAGLAAVSAAIGELEEDDRTLAEGLHEVVTEIAPQLVPKTYYGMPAYADDDGKVVVFFQAAGKFKTRYATVGFQDQAALDDGDLWPVAFAVVAWTPAVKQQIAALIRRSVA